MKRECGECTRCCEGWLTGTIRGHDMCPGTKCHFLVKDRCSIYADRPQEPCRVFNCGWLQNADVPDWLYPLISKVIIKERFWGENNDKKWWQLTDCGQSIDAATLAWFAEHNNKTGISMSYFCEETGAVHAIGSPEFKAWVNF
jgi:hypothetical protein